MSRRRVKSAPDREQPRCSTCGYDLGGLPAGAPCPECGETWPERPRLTTKARMERFGFVAMALLFIAGGLYILIGAIGSAMWLADFEANSIRTVGVVIDQDQWNTGGRYSRTVYSPQFLFTDELGKEWRSRASGSSDGWNYPLRSRVYIRYRTDDPRIVRPAERFMIRYLGVLGGLAVGAPATVGGAFMLWCILDPRRRKPDRNPLHAITRRRAAVAERAEETRRAKRRRHTARRG